jgi:hypothetical protein
MAAASASTQKDVIVARQEQRETLGRHGQHDKSAKTQPTSRWHVKGQGTKAGRASGSKRDPQKNRMGIVLQKRQTLLRARRRRVCDHWMLKMER